MRTLISFLVGLVTAAVVVGLGVLVAQNGQDAQLSVLGTPVRAAQGGSSPVRQCWAFSWPF